MITIFNRKELLITLDMKKQSEIREILSANNIDGTITATLTFHLFFNALSITPLNTISSTNPAAIPVNATPALKVLNI